MISADEVVKSLESNGILLQQDRHLPSVVSLLTGEPLLTSWWAHPLANSIYEILGQLATDPHVVFAKLVTGKVTLIHVRVWPALMAVVTAGESWQLDGLSFEASDLLNAVEKQDTVATGPLAKELELRLLVRGEQVHTASGKHAIKLESWPRWAGRVGCTTSMTPSEGRKLIESVLCEIGGKSNMLPWA